VNAPSGPPSAAQPRLPDHDPADPAENAVIARLAGNWSRRAAVKQPEPDLDDLFEPDRPDYPERILPFRDHPTYRGLDRETKNRLLAWAWIAFNKNVMDIERVVVNPGFALLAADVFDMGLGESMALAVTEAMVDEQYHVLMHLNASAVTRRRRGWRMPDSALPVACKARRHQFRTETADHDWQRELCMLAFTTVAEVSVNAYLDLIANDAEVQPVNRATAVIHNRDEYCHSSIAGEIAKAAYPRLGAEQQDFFREALADGMQAFAANDFTTWHRIIELTGVAGGQQMLEQVQHDPAGQRLLQDFSGLHRLSAEMGLVEALPFDWSTVSVR